MTGQSISVERGERGGEKLDGSGGGPRQGSGKLCQNHKQLLLPWRSGFNFFSFFLLLFKKLLIFWLCHAWLWDLP